MGKTALTRVLGEQFGVHAFFEWFEVNPFLDSSAQQAKEKVPLSEQRRLLGSDLVPCKTC